MKKLHYLFILLLFLPTLSCKKKYALDGSIDNSDFIGKWVLPLGTAHDIFEIKENGNIIYTYVTYDNNSPDRDGSTSKEKGRIQIEGDKMLLEYRFLMKENSIREKFIIKWKNKSKYYEKDNNSLTFSCFCFSCFFSNGRIEFTKILVLPLSVKTILYG